MGSGYSKMKKQRKAFEEQYSKMQEEMVSSEYEGTSEGNLVKVVLQGNKTLKSIKIDPSCVDPEDVEGLEDLIQSAFKKANENLEEASPINTMNPMDLF